MKNLTLLFYKLFDHLKVKSHWKLILLLSFLITVLTSILYTYSIDWVEEMKRYKNSQTDQATLFNIVLIMGTIGRVMNLIFKILIYFSVFLIISIFTNSNIKKTSILSASILMKLIENLIGFLIITINYIFHINPQVYSITSLNIIDKNNEMLRALDFVLVINSYIFGIILYAVLYLKFKTSLLLSILFLIFSIFVKLALSGYFF